MSIGDKQISKAVDEIFNKFDMNRNNYLGPREVLEMMNFGLRSIGRKGNATFADA